MSRVVCAWCNKIMRPGPPPVSHGCCDECIEKVLGPKRRQGEQEMTIKRTVDPRIPTPLKTEGRCAFGIAWFKTEDEAQLYARHIALQGDAYNGGWFHGMPCGRDKAFDYIDDQHGRLYAVTTR